MFKLFTRLSFLGFVVAVLLVGFSSVSHAVTYYNDPYGSGWWTTGNAACITSHAAYPPPAGVTFSGFVAPQSCTYSNGGYHYLNLATSCPSGTTVAAGETQCATPCSIAGQVHDAGGACTCPSGQSVTSGDMFTALNGGGSQACRTPAQECATRSGQSRLSTWPLNSIDGCVVTCGANTASTKTSYPYSCIYNGQTMGTPSGATLSSGTATPVTPDPLGPEIPPGCTSAPTAGCAGKSYGYVNGVAVCASTSSSCAPGGSSGATSGGTPIANGAPAGTTVETQTTSTTSNSNGTTTTTTVHTTIGGTGTGGSGTGTGSGTGSGSGSGTAGTCDPTAQDYLQCLAGTGSEYGNFGEGDHTRDSVSDDFYSGLQQTGIGQMASSVSGGLPSGACPVVHFSMFNRDFTMDMWCTIYDENAGVLSVVARAGWVLMGIVIILGA